MDTPTEFDYVFSELATPEFLEDVLKYYFDDETLKVEDMVVSDLLTPDDCRGFASVLHRNILTITRSNELEILSLVIKYHPKGTRGVLARKSEIFHREIIFYNKILPRLKELIENVDDVMMVAPRCYYTTELLVPFLILEDMEKSGYVNFERCRLFDLEYTLLIIQKLAKFHACSAVLASKSPNIMDYFQEAPISSEAESKRFLGFFATNIQCVAKVVAEWQDFEEIGEKLYKLSEKIAPNITRMYQSEDLEFRVLNLADFWINNLMFRVNANDEPEDVIMLDFQLAYYGSPAADLNYFLYGSVDENVRKMYLKEIVKEYHQTLIETLGQLNYNDSIPTLKDINIAMIKYSLIGVIAATCLTPQIFMENRTFENLKKLTYRSEESDKIRKGNAENLQYKAFLQRTIKDFDLCGFLD